MHIQADLGLKAILLPQLPGCNGSCLTCSPSTQLHKLIFFFTPIRQGLNSIVLIGLKLKRSICLYLLNAGMNHYALPKS